MRRILSILAATAVLTGGALSAAAAPPTVPSTGAGKVQAGKIQAAGTVTADFAGSAGTGHADVFGSGINKLEDWTKADALRNSGSRIIRRDAYLNEILPKGITLADYLANRNNVADPATWDWSQYEWVNEYHRRGFKILLIMSYSVHWLGSRPGDVNAWHSPPNSPDGFRAYEDVIKKIYQRFQDKVAMVEIWNEPNLGGFLDLAGSPYPDNPQGRLTAYKDMYYHAARGIRAVSTTVPIGGPSLSHKNLTETWSGGTAYWVRDFFADTRIRDNINFLTYHHYTDHFPTREEGVTAWKQAAQDAGKGANFPVYVTEWNYSASYDLVPLNAHSPETISFTGDRLTRLYKQQANGAMYFADNNEQHSPFFGVHENNMLPPKARTFRLLSQDLGLGFGNSTIRPVSFGAPVSNAGAATTSAGDQVAWVVNDGTEPLDVSLNLTGLGTSSANVAHVFEASPAQTAGAPKTSVPVTVANGSTTVRVSVPPKSVSGVRLASYPVADMENLAPAATVTASSVTTEYPQLNARATVDGLVGIHGGGEWASHRELAPWLELRWSGARTVGQVVLHDRANLVDQVTSGSLLFSDGSRVPIPVLPHDGTSKAITFTPRSTTSIRVELSGAGMNVGLSEIQVHAGANVAPAATATASSFSGLLEPVRAVDGIVGSRGEWASAETNPTFRLQWANRQVITGVTLADRPGTADANSGTLVFSDGSSVPVTGLAGDGTPKEVTFAPKVVTSLRFEITGGSGSQVGLSEIRVRQAPNLASSATVTGSSTAPEFPALDPTRVTDGVINQWGAGEWAANRAQGTSPSVRLTWPTAQTVSRVALYDRNNGTDHTNGGTLVFSDGSTVPVGTLDNSGIGLQVSFPARNVTWVEFRLTSSPATWMAGLSEVEAF